MKKKTQIIWVSSFLLAAIGFLLPFWPLVVMGVLLSAFSGRWLLALLLGFLIDCIYGVPVGELRLLYVPFTLLAAVGALLRYSIAGRWREVPLEHLQ
jgi:hypothetical protein